MLPLLVALVALRLSEWQERRELARDRADFIAAEDVRQALREYTGKQGMSCSEFVTVEDAVRSLRAEGRVSGELADYVLKNRERFTWQRHEMNFDAAWAIRSGEKL